MKKVMFVLLAAITLAACTKGEVAAPKKESVRLYWRIEAAETTGNTLYSNVAATKN